MNVKIIRAGICSYGMSGKLFHAPFLQAHPGYELKAIVERNNQDSRERYPDAKLYRSVEALCADPELDLIVVNTPTHLHYEQAKLVLNSGKHMVIEKPFAVTAAQAGYRKRKLRASALLAADGAGRSSSPPQQPSCFASISNSPFASLSITPSSTPNIFIC